MSEGPEQRVLFAPAEIAPEPWLEGCNEVRSMFVDVPQQATEEADSVRLSADLTAQLAASEAELGSTVSRYTASIANLDAAAEKAGRMAAAEVVDLALIVAQAILARELSSEGEALLAAVDGALTSIQQRPIVVRVHPDDYEAVLESKDFRLESGIELASDDTLIAGECVVESEDLTIDTTVASRLSALREALVDLVASEVRDDK